VNFFVFRIEKKIFFGYEEFQIGRGSMV